MFHVYTGIAYLYVLWRFVLQLPLSRSWRVVIAILLLIASKHHFLSQLAFGNMFSPEVPRAVIIMAAWGFFVFVVLFVFTLAMDLAKGILALAGRRLARPGMFMTAAAAVAMILSAYGVGQAIRVPDVRRVPLAIRDLPPALEGFRLVQLTDLHISRLFAAPWVEAVVTKTQQLNPDLIVITGDLIDGTVDSRKQDVAPLAALHAPQGVLAITGNHEYYFDARQWVPAFQRLGIRMLLNEHVTIDTRGARLTIAGVTDAIATAHGMAGPDLGEALKGAPKEAPVILLAHRPMGAQQNAAQGVAVQLSGHTHGGMVKGLDKLLSYPNGGYISGRYDVGGMQLYVSNGTGLWNGFPVRIGVPAEITEFVLQRAP